MIAFAVVLTVIAVAMVTIVVRSNRTVTPTSSSQALQGLPVIQRSTSDPSYRRAAFGASWADLDSDGCNTRDEVLLATVDRSKPYRVQRHRRCRADIVAGTWTDSYTGTVTTWTDLKQPVQAEGLPVDHIVSLAEAFRYGAKNWTAQRRISFSNDGLNLTPTLESVNRLKGDKDPADWTPPEFGRCFYATRYIAVKARWNLPVDPKEKAALQRLLSSCPD